MPEYTHQQNANHFTRLFGITNTTAASARTVKLNPALGATFGLVLQSGTPATGAAIQVTISSAAEIDADTATWYTPAGTGNSTANQLLGNAVTPTCQLTGVRAVVTDGTWTLEVRQA